MRITNKMLSNNFLRDMRTNLNNLSTIQTQMATGKQINKPSDDPAKASKIMQMYSEIDANKQYNENITNTSNWLDMTDSTLGQVGKITTRIQELLVSAGNGAYGPNEKAAVKDEINQRVGELSQILNTSFDGKYIFGGTSGTIKPVGTELVGENTNLTCTKNPKVVATLTAGTMTSASPLAADNSTALITFGTDKLTVDGTEISVDWKTLLTEDQKTQINSDLTAATLDTLSSIKDTLVSAINTAIDNSGKDVSHVTGSLDSSNKMVLKSGDVGTKSEVTLTAIATGSIGAKILSNTAGDISGGTSSPSPNLGTSVYSGKTVAATDTFNMSLNGVSMNLTGVVISGTTSMNDAAAGLTAKIAEAITTANIGKKAGQSGYIEPVTVKANDDGTFGITSPSGDVTFFDDNGKSTAKDLGLSDALKDKLLVEISQGVTMDYNVTASQIINYGTGDNNIIKLLTNITSHLDSTNSTVTKKLSNEDLTGIQAFATNVLKLRSEVGAKQNSMDSALARNSDQNTNMTEILTKTENIDITEKAMEYATMQTIYMAALQTSAKVIQPSLLDYLR
ncbi:flagellar hook-associated protein FlgL [Clostridium estertheticum]|uniref:flagellar hook-associated protein FlgL n=1 Tax=Clostridium estertheticum TaxID=238834 RepID=UPI001CF29408|nr:flagellar hook-associated protein FlgL [Clostridium estertheticum]MCB2308803.1 flagellar hook-associated protein FlgL [Clostridium estertheticum]MCB2347119.1 flagellar hook-associated protein FlgL [Clostridium estertheticum]MCB2351789.1 flagellar hook-associated protein FlgL [Clostridium estertheticum]WAG44489.1 flagellar hook-associated protein FlgL [Clostridium estertheticum]